MRRVCADGAVIQWDGPDAGRVISTRRPRESARASDDATVVTRRGSRSGSGHDAPTVESAACPGTARRIAQIAAHGGECECNPCLDATDFLCDEQDRLGLSDHDGCFICGRDVDRDADLCALHAEMAASYRD